MIKIIIIAHMIIVYQKKSLLFSKTTIHLIYFNKKSCNIYFKTNRY